FQRTHAFLPCRIAWPLAALNALAHRLAKSNDPLAVSFAYASPLLPRPNRATLPLVDCWSFRMQSARTPSLALFSTVACFLRVFIAHPHRAPSRDAAEQSAAV